MRFRIIQSIQIKIEQISLVIPRPKSQRHRRRRLH
eukprot:SAG31_NODE_29346_length_396_cov_1.555556_1_plen_34_part_10